MTYRPIVLTYDDALRALRETVQERPTYVYERDETAGNPCAYVRDGAPSCGVGVALARLGVPIDRLRHADECDEDSNARYLEDLGVVRWGDEAVAELLNAFQAEQDCGVPWVHALDRAVEAVMAP